MRLFGTHCRRLKIRCGENGRRKRQTSILNPQTPTRGRLVKGATETISCCNAIEHFWQRPYSTKMFFLMSYLPSATESSGFYRLEADLRSCSLRSAICARADWPRRRSSQTGLHPACVPPRSSSGEFGFIHKPCFICLLRVPSTLPFVGRDVRQRVRHTSCSCRKQKLSRQARYSWAR